MAADKDGIKHVVVLTLENRSFDQMLGCMKQVNPAIDGIDPGDPGTNKDLDGTVLAQEPGAIRVASHDPLHEYVNVINQLRDRNGGFVSEYSRTHPDATVDQKREVMRYYELGALPALHALATEFVVCDRWFSSLPGPTWPNRLFLHSGTSEGRVTMPTGILNPHLHWYDQATIFDRLNEHRIPWRIYYGDVPQSLVLVNQLLPENAARYSRMSQFYIDVAREEETFPGYVFIEPAYYEPGANDDHPPHDVLGGQMLLAGVYNALRANEDLWNNTLLVVLYDEHGGFYDHVVPDEVAGDAVPPDHHMEDGFSFRRYGVRVPAVLASPFLDPGVDHTVMDHTSLLRYLTDKWQLRPLRDRVAAAKTFTMTRQSPRMTTQRIPGTPAGMARPPEMVVTHFNTHQTALVALSHLIESMAAVVSEDVAHRSRQLLSGFQSQVDVAVDRVEEFLAQSRKEAGQRGSMPPRAASV